MGYIYKCVPVPETITTGVVGKDSHARAVEEYQSIINRNAGDGWELFSVDYIYSKQNPGCLGSLFGKKVEEARFKLLIYRRMESAEKTNPAPAAKHKSVVYGRMTDNEVDEALGASQAEELRKNKKLLDGGILTQEEYDKKKMQILGL
jgi:hypothetical protein